MNSSQAEDCGCERECDEFSCTFLFSFLFLFFVFLILSFEKENENENEINFLNSNYNSIFNLIIKLIKKRRSFI